MARNSSGTMSAVNGPYVSGTTISSSAVNARFSDEETEMTDSLSRSGKGGMLAALRGVDGTVAAPAVSFTSDTGTGWFRAAASDLRAAIAGTAVFKLLASSLVSLFPHTFTGTAAEAPVILTPLAAPSAPSNGGVWVETTANTLRTRINGATKTALLSGASSTGAIVRGDLPAVSFQTSSSTGTGVATTSGTYADITGLTVTFTPTGRPVWIGLVSDGVAPLQLTISTSAQVGTIAIVKDGTAILEVLHQGQSNAAAYQSPQPYIWDPAPSNASHTYKVQAKTTGGASLNFVRYVLVAYEL